MEPVHKQFIVYQCLKALLYCHSANLIHRDLNPSNLLLNEDCLCKIANFERARSLRAMRLGDRDEADNMTSLVSDNWYQAPEVLLGSTNYSFAVDMWALGCIIAEMFVGKPLLPGENRNEQLEKIFEVTGLPSPEEEEAITASNGQMYYVYYQYLIAHVPRCEKKSLATLMTASPEVIDIVEKLLVFDSTKRLTVEQAFEHSYVSCFRTGAEVRHSGSINLPLAEEKATAGEYHKMLESHVSHMEAQRISRRNSRASIRDSRASIRDSRASIRDSRTSSSAPDISRRPPYAKVTTREDEGDDADKDEDTHEAPPELMQNTEQLETGFATVLPLVAPLTSTASSFGSTDSSYVLTPRGEKIQEMADFVDSRDNLGHMDNHIHSILAAGVIRLLSISFVLAQNEGWLVQRRQVLERVDGALLAPGVASALLKEGNRRVLVLSYGWLTKGHPDPNGDRVRVLVRFLRNNPSVGDGGGIFWDFASLPQHALEHGKLVRRTNEEEAIFQSGLSAMADLYASPIGTSVLQIKSIPPRPSTFNGEYNEMDYDSRGWVTAESIKRFMLLPLTDCSHLCSVLLRTSSRRRGAEHQRRSPTDGWSHECN